MLCYKAYQTSPCGWYGSSDPECVDNGLVSHISLWWEAIPYALGGFSELFVNVPGMMLHHSLLMDLHEPNSLYVAYGIAYSRAPVNLRGLVSAINLFSAGFANIVNLAASTIVADPYLIWDFAGPAILGAIVTVTFVRINIRLPRYIKCEQMYLQFVSGLSSNILTRRNTCCPQPRPARLWRL